MVEEQCERHAKIVLFTKATRVCLKSGYLLTAAGTEDADGRRAGRRATAKIVRVPQGDANNLPMDVRKKLREKRGISKLITLTDKNAIPRLMTEAKVLYQAGLQQQGSVMSRQYTESMASYANCRKR